MDYNNIEKKAIIWEFIIVLLFLWLLLSLLYQFIVYPMFHDVWKEIEDDNIAYLVNKKNPTLSELNAVCSDLKYASVEFMQNNNWYEDFLNTKCSDPKIWNYDEIYDKCVDITHYENSKASIADKQFYKEHDCENEIKEFARNYYDITKYQFNYLNIFE